jgi:hypothetical protein
MHDLAAAGRTQVLAHYDWDALAERLDAVWLNTARPHSMGRVA